MPSEMKRLKQLEEENGRLKRIVADLSLDNEMLQDIIRRKYDACSEAADSRSHAVELAGEHSSSLPRSAGGSIDLSLPPPASRAGGA